MNIATISHSYESLSNREKVLVLLSTMAVVLGLLFITLIEPQYLALQDTRVKLERNQQAFQLSSQEIQHQQQLLDTDPKQATANKLEQLLAAQNELAENLAQSQLAVLSTDAFSAFLTLILEGAKQIQVDDFLLSAAPFSSEDAYEEDGASSVLQQSVRLKISGDDQQILSYLRQVEAMPVALVWDSIDYQYLAGEQRTVSIAFHLYTAVE